MKKETYRKAKLAVMILAVAAFVICSLFLNVMGGIALCLNGYENCGISLFVSTFFLLLAVVLLGKGRMILPSVMNIIGTAGYIYAIYILDSIPNEKVAKTEVAPLIGNIYPAAAVTVLVFITVFLNYFSPVREEKREARKKAIYEANERPLSKDEKII